MINIVVERIISRREFGTIFAGGDENGATIHVKAGRDVIIGVPGIGEVWTVDGDIEQTAWGPQIKASRAVRSRPTGKLIVDYLAGSVAGVGPTRAKRLWRHFGELLPEALDVGDVDALAAIMEPDRPVLGPRLAASMVAAWKKVEGQNRLVEWLGSVGVTDLRLAKRVHALLGDDAPAMLAQNPWCLVPLLPWDQVDELGLKLAAESGDRSPETLDNRIVGAADAIVKDLIASGSTAMRNADFPGLLAKKLGTLPTGALDLALRTRALVPATGDLLRAPGCALMEETVFERLSAIRDLPPLSGMDRMLQQAMSADSGLSDEQVAATRQVLSASFACLRGGAGVGKTYVTNEVCRILQAAGGNLLLAAIAGKAALRLSRATGILARTVHRLIGELDERARITEELHESTDAGERKKHESRLRELAHCDDRTLVIIDEASMLDLSSLHKLLARLHPEARLLLIGDECQLPPVSFGLIFHRIVTDASVTATLRTVRRQAVGSDIPAVAGQVRQRNAPFLDAYRGEPAGVFLQHADTSKCIAEAVVGLRKEFDGTDVMIVTPVNDGAVGVSGLNRRLHDDYAERTGFQELRGPMGDLFSPGEPLLHRRNDYQRGLWNGSMGRVRRIDRDRRQLIGLFDEEEIAFEAEDLVDLSLGYALTCHRSQGSEATNVIIALPQSKLLDPSWLYTAITRARSLAIIVGRAETIEEALSRPYADERRHVGFRWSAPK